MDESTLRDYILNTSFHGFRFIAENGRHWTERIFWTICCILSWIATGLLIQSAWDDFQNNAISFVVDTSYLEWDTNFPSISICESDNQKRIAEVTDRTYGDPHDYNLDEIVKEVVFFRGLSFYTLQICGPEAQFPNENCFKRNFSDFSAQVRSTCPDIFQKCKWNQEPFDCCKYFAKIDSEMGACYAINSIQTHGKAPRLSMVSNKNTGPGSLYLEINGHSNVYILGEQEVPTLTTLTTDILQVTPHIHYRRFFAIKEIENEPEVEDVSIRQRKCRFTHESNLDVYPYYSYSSCCVQCRKDAQIRTCNCAHHLVPNTPPETHCNITGLYCLSKHYNELSVLKPYWASRTGLVCDCLPSCTEIELSVIKDDKVGINEDFAIVELILERLPTERYKRNVVRGKLDLADNSRKFLIAALAGFYTANPVYMMNPNYTTYELKRFLEVSRPKIVFCNQQYLNKIKSMDYTNTIVTFDERGRGALFFDDLIKNLGNFLKMVTNFNTEDQVAIICNSSGTSGPQKGVMITHENLRLTFGHASDQDLYPLTPESNCILQVIPFYHVYGFSVTCCALYMGAKVAIMDRFQPEMYLEAIQNFRVNKLFVVPTLANFLANTSLTNRFNLSSVDEIYSAAGAVPPEITTSLIRKFNLKLIRQCYGLTELSAAVFMTPINEIRSGSCGKLTPGHQVKIIDTSTGEILGSNRSGEICVKGANMKGYLNNPEATEATIDGSGFVHTGDVGFYDNDKFFYIIDRLKDIIKYKSFQVPPQEIEEILLRHPLIKEAAVVGKPDDRYGELAVAFIVKQEGEEIEGPEIIDYVAAHVCVEKRLHGGVRFVKEIPKSPMGKILRKQLRDLLQ